MLINMLNVSPFNFHIRLNKWKNLKDKEDLCFSLIKLISHQDLWKESNYRQQIHSKVILPKKTQRISHPCTSTMNSSVQLYNLQERYADSFAKNFTIVFLAVIIVSINGVFVYIFFRSSIFYNDPRYILYIHLVINDMLMVCLSVTLFVMSFAWQNVPFPFCFTLLIVAATAHKNTPLTLASMAVERYIAICKPLHHHQICTVRRTYILISLIWGVGVIPGLNDLIVIVIVRPLSVFKTVALCSSATLYNTPYHEELSKITLGLYTSVVWLILVFTYCQVLVAARRASADKTSAKKAQSTILLHGAQLLLCMLSYITPVLDKIFLPLVTDQQKRISFFNYLLTNIVPRLLTPLIYGVRDKHFYNHLKGFYSCKLPVVKVEPSKQ
ncbi:odorant receptor 131-2-like [Cyprinus carpio]|uniref:Odorant receptor 131-2-like n=2 Tax=Cyprinus carpio TaxID=7962 RepID=A0A9R0A0S0_CYPCA|nr:odorant receptor 131-2-like [Cyprinus carpio]